METNNSHLGFVGGGRVTRIILRAFANKSVEFKSVMVVEPDKAVMSKLQSDFHGISAVTYDELAEESDLIFLAVHPPSVMEVAGKISGKTLKDAIIISLAPKITIEKLSGVLKNNVVARMIPNATSYISEGYNPISFDKNVPQKIRTDLVRILEPLGENFVVEENKLESYAIISAMLPTYFWFQWHKMEEIALATGFKSSEAKKLIQLTLEKSLKLFYDSDLTAEEVIDLVPVKPIGDHEEEIENILETKLLSLYNKIKP